MFLSCPVSLDLIHAEWFSDLDAAKESALDWSVDLCGENVIVYEAIENDEGIISFNKLCAIFA